MPKIGLFLFAAAMILACNPKKKVVENQVKTMDYEDSPTLTAVLEKAKLQSKPVFIDFYTDWCLPCKIMDEEVFSDPGIYKYMNDQFINYKVNGEEGSGPNLVFLYGIQVYPGLVFVDEKGEVLLQQRGSLSYSAFKKMAEEARAKFDQEIP